jgi:hypothetical protein
MEIRHTISFPRNDAVIALLQSTGVHFDESEFCIRVKINESSPCFLSVADFARSSRAVEIVENLFSQDEIDNASWFAIYATSHFAFPEPKDDWGYLRESFDLAAYCAECGLGKRQIRALRTKKEPIWSKASFAQLHWIFDEFLTNRDVSGSFLRDLGIAFRPVIKHQTNSPFASLIQLEIHESVSIKAKGIIANLRVCNRCKRDKYLPATAGFFPTLAEIPSSNIFRTKEHFGDGARSASAIIVSKEFHDRFTELNLKGLVFRPLK